MDRFCFNPSNAYTQKREKGNQGNEVFFEVFLMPGELALRLFLTTDPASISNTGSMRWVVGSAINVLQAHTSSSSYPSSSPPVPAWGCRRVRGAS